MSIYSTIDLTQSEAIKLIAEHICASPNRPEGLENKTDNELLEMILFRVTDTNKYSPFHDNNYWIVQDPEKSTLAQFKEEKYLS